MMEFIQPADRPVVSGLEEFEVVYAKHQPEYNPLRTILSRTEEGRVLSRWSPTRQQRAEIMAGADIYLELATFNKPLQPIRMAIGVDVDPDYIKEQYALPEQVDDPQQ